MRIASIVLMSFGLLAYGSAALADDTKKPTVDAAWRGPGWYWLQGDMFGMPLLAGDVKPGVEKQSPFDTEAACEARYHTTCTYYPKDPLADGPK